MKPSASTKHLFAAWEDSFRAAAEADQCETFRAHLQRLNLPDDPILLLEGTILFVRQCVAFLVIDNHPVESFLAQQTYHPVSVPDSSYQVTFDIHGLAYARLNLPASLSPIDLSDLYETPWDSYRRVGYCDLWISRSDGKSLGAEEIEEFEKAVTYDLMYDHEQDELAFWFDPDTQEGILKVTVQDVVDE